MTRNFRRTSLMAGLVAPGGRRSDTIAASGRIVGNLETRALEGVPAVIEVKTAYSYETQIANVVSALVSGGISAFLFTSRGSRLDRSTTSIRPLHLYLMTPAVSYYKAGQNEYEVLISSENTSVILDAIGKVVKTAAEQKVGLVFDNISDMILSLGFPMAYKFLASALEVVSDSNVISIFIMVSGGLDEAVENSILARFPIILANDAATLRVVKAPV